MTEKVGGDHLVYEEVPRECELCGRLAELRPYGPDGEKVCFECGMKDEESCRERFLGEKGDIIQIDLER